MNYYANLVLSFIVRVFLIAGISETNTKDLVYHADAAHTTATTTTTTSNNSER